MTNKPNEEENENNRTNGDGQAEQCECRCEGAEENPGEGEMGGGETGVLKKKIDSLEKALKDKSDEMLRRAADMDNYRKRLIKESEERVKYANQAVVKDFLGVLDNIELTLRHTEPGSSLRQGIELTIKSFKDTLLKHGIEEIEAEPGTPFDPARHDAMMMDSTDDFDNNAITMNVQKGYTLNGRVVRPAKVKVNKK